VIHHLSHELKTPVSILSASLNLIKKRISEMPDQQYDQIFERAQRNLQRLLEMQYQLEDILREKDYQTHQMLSALLDACADELEVLISLGLGEQDIIRKIRQHIDDTYGPRESKSEEIELGPYVKDKIKALRPNFAHRKCRLRTYVLETAPIYIPADVLGKVVEGLVRNAVENTPDGGKISVKVRKGEIGPELEVKDSGIGISEENLRLIFENYFTSYDTMQYSTRQPYDFKAGGKGFDLLRMKIFSERYHFKLYMHSDRCRHLADIGTGITEVGEQEDSARGTHTGILRPLCQRGHAAHDRPVAPKAQKNRAMPGFFVDKANTYLLFGCVLDLGFNHRSINQLDVRHRRLVTRAMAALEDAQITTRALLVARAQFGKQLADRGIAAQAGESQTPLGNAVFFRHGDQGLGHTTQFLRLRQGRLDQFLLDQRGGHVAKHGLAVCTVTVQLPSGFAVTHGSTS
jgi:hypothetical protein